jgi:hypothetical protein
MAQRQMVQERKVQVRLGDLNLMVNHFISMTRLVMPMVFLLKELLGNLTLTIAKTF